jgi:hypothetical protein
MNPPSVIRLAGVDLSLQRGPATGYGVAAILGAALAAMPDPGVKSLGVSLVLCVLIAQCFHLPIVTVFQDITRGTRVFTLSLPVTPAEYAAGKLLANVLLFLIPAGAVLVAVLATPASERLFPPGLVLLLLLGGLIFFLQNLGIALVTESMGAGIVSLLAGLFIVGNGLPLVARHSSLCLKIWGGLHAGGPVLVAGFAVLGTELAGTVLLIVLLMGRKRQYF